MCSYLTNFLTCGVGSMASLNCWVDHCDTEDILYADWAMKTHRVICENARRALRGEEALPLPFKNERQVIKNRQRRKKANAVKKT